MMASSCNPHTFGDDDKYTKFARASKTTPGPSQKYHEALCTFDTHLFKNSTFGFACAYALLALSYVLFGGKAGMPMFEKFLNVTSISVEIIALLILRYKIQSRNSVKGISGMSMLMYAVVYLVRMWLNMPTWNFNWNSNFMELEPEVFFGVISLLLVLDCLKSIFVTHRSSYQAELDVLSAQHLIPSCFLMALLLRPHFHGWTNFYGYMWSSCLYMDILALLPQVIMMARGGGKVEAPIAHFVAATFVSRIEDLSDSLLFHGNTLRSDEYFSYYAVIFFQALHLLLVADFMYYYMKARSCGTGSMDSTMDLQMDITVEV